MNDYTLHSLDNPPPQFVQTLRAALTRYNQSVTGEARQQLLAVCANDKAERTVGAVYGWIQWGWLYIDLIWIEETLRGQGIGSRLLARLEDAALERGVDRVRLDTGSFQAPGFYQRHGFEIYAQLDIVADDGSNHLIYSMKKPSISASRAARQSRTDAIPD